MSGVFRAAHPSEREEKANAGAPDDVTASSTRRGRPTTIGSTTYVRPRKRSESRPPTAKPSGCVEVSSVVLLRYGLIYGSVLNSGGYTIGW